MQKCQQKASELKGLHYSLLIFNLVFYYVHNERTVRQIKMEMQCNVIISSSVQQGIASSCYANISIFTRTIVINDCEGGSGGGVDVMIMISSKLHFTRFNVNS